MLLGSFSIGCLGTPDEIIVAGSGASVAPTLPGTTGLPGQIYLTDEYGAAGWKPNHPTWLGHAYHEFENGGTGRLGRHGSLGPWPGG